MRAQPAPELLRPRELEILGLIVEGLTNDEIAARLFVSVATVRWHIKEIYGKLDIHRRADVTARARELHLVTVADEATTRHNLPLQSTPFVGRQAELDDLARLIADRDVRLVTILAPGGMGKTRLALASAERQLSRFADGVFFVPLAPLSSADDMLTTIADSVSFSLYGSGTPRQRLLDHFRERTLLLVLDNVEHVLEGGALLVRDLIDAAPGVKVLATSREKLNLRGERVFSLSGLLFPDGETDPNALDYDAGQLFVQSAHEAHANVEFSADDLTIVGQICRLTAGMPLALVLAAGWLDMLPLKRIAVELQHGLDILDADWQDVPERQRSLRATFQSTWDRLSDAERETFMRLSVFRGGFTAEAAQVVASATLTILRRLVNRALVQADRAGRFTIHELLRQYAGEQLTAAEADAARSAHSAYFMDFLTARNENVKGRRQEEALAEIRADFENIRQGWLWAVERRQYEAIGAALECVGNSFSMNNRRLEETTLLQATVAGLQGPPGETPHPVWDLAAAMFVNAGKSFPLPTLSHNVVEAILERSLKRGSPRDAAFALASLRLHATNRRNLADQFALSERYLALWREVGDEFYIAQAIGEMGLAYIAHHEPERGLALVRESADMRRRRGNRRELPFILFHLGAVLTSFGRIQEARAPLDEALAVQDEIGKVGCYPGVSAFWAFPRFLNGDFEAAARQAEAGLRFDRDRPWGYGGVVTEIILGYVASMAGDYERARDLCSEDPGGTLSALSSMCMEWGQALAGCGLGNDDAVRGSLHRILVLAADAFYSPTFETLCLPPAAILAARADQAERAVELLGLASTAPPEMIGWMAKWPLLDEVRSRLEQTLGAEDYQIAFERGMQLDVLAVVAELRAAWEAAAS